MAGNPIQSQDFEGRTFSEIHFLECQIILIPAKAPQAASFLLG